ncbi:Pimeloyl-ACP methyl ester carboxylesterase [Chitinophaga ginsengisegetis]|uniref:Pimeloyl-ACP methyl ester carboxylesterase n=1 Tax=Chitinophaga ginsengisegetis TaxID=393003 RepID=A0A1T5P9F9_9BACT|nr:alpha/beta hydrolase [Chitinophaga ginsengisegetis]SKD09233.1 Pimeloyl-ACP methyl ester carboxylesterase [Chitinophaga ginsengisegetis]
MKQHMKIRGINVVYDDYGSGETIVFIHGQPFNRSMWDPQVAAFKSGYRLIVPDLRGYGESEIPSGITLLDELALDIIHLLEALKITKATFVGLSMGGQVVFELYRLAPHLCNALVLADTDAKSESAQSYQARLQLSKDLVEKGMSFYTDQHLHQFLGKTTMAEKPSVVADLRHMMVTTNPLGASLVQRGRAERRDHTLMLPDIHCPVLIVVGEEDGFTPVAVAKGMQEHIKHAQLVVIKDASHMPNMEQPEIFNRHLELFLQGIK